MFVHCHSEPVEKYKFIFFEIKFAVSKIVRIFAVQYRGIEQSVARRAHNPKVVRFESHSRYQEKADANLLFSFITAAGVLKLVDKPDLGSGAERRMGSIPFARTRKKLSYIGGH